MSSARSALQLARFTPESMVVLYDEVLAADQATLDVQDLPAGYRHLRIELTARSTQAVTTGTMVMTFNGDTGNNYADQHAQVNSSVGGRSCCEGDWCHRVPVVLADDLQQDSLRTDGTGQAE